MLRVHYSGPPEASSPASLASSGVVEQSSRNKGEEDVSEVGDGTPCKTCTELYRGRARYNIKSCPGVIQNQQCTVRFPKDGVKSCLTWRNSKCHDFRKTDRNIAKIELQQVHLHIKNRDTAPSVRDNCGLEETKDGVEGQGGGWVDSTWAILIMRGCKMIFPRVLASTWKAGSLTET
ncbi:hypothetical protein ONS95_005731 [Cadophora gregata]|uniref:uncharacterized protein n=1 Tax=Cadophora gregata TaxID=51156 RepID=UPI0026DC2C15|nr:uncharacterized protein ONS95_005731 [Cadophora gregata]KAK0103725.1 hypothetical protein ONS95_005731 [Cadophora gregata]